MKKPDYLIIASTETAELRDVTKQDIIELHTSSRAHGGLGFNRPGIDYLVDLNGNLETILPEEAPNEVDLWGLAEGTNGLNGTAKVLAYAGGISGTSKSEKTTKEKDTRTEGQKETLETVVKFFTKRFTKLQILGWDQIPSKADAKNPGFDVPKWLEEIGVPKANIFQNQ